MLKDSELILTQNAMVIYNIINQKISDGDSVFLEQMNQNLSNIVIPEIILHNQ